MSDRLHTCGMSESIFLAPTFSIFSPQIIFVVLCSTSQTSCSSLVCCLDEALEEGGSMHKLLCKIYKLSLSNLEFTLLLPDSNCTRPSRRNQKKFFLIFNSLSWFPSMTVEVKYMVLIFHYATCHPNSISKKIMVYQDQ